MGFNPLTDRPSPESEEFVAVSGLWLEIGAQRLDLECGDVSPLSNRATCRPVPKRGLVRALQIKAPPK